MAVSKNKAKTLPFLLALALGSTAAMSTAHYYLPKRVSALECHESPSPGTPGGVLNFVPRGVMNWNKSTTGGVNCPVHLLPGTWYNIEATFLSNRTNGSVTIDCNLRQFDGFSGVLLSEDKNVAGLSAGTSGSIIWYNIMSYSADSYFGLNCRLPPRTGILNIMVTPEL